MLPRALISRSESAAFHETWLSRVLKDRKQADIADQISTYVE